MAGEVRVERRRSEVIQRLVGGYQHSADEANCVCLLGRECNYSYKPPSLLAVVFLWFHQFTFGSVLTELLYLLPLSFVCATIPLNPGLISLEHLSYCIFFLLVPPALPDFQTNTTGLKLGNMVPFVQQCLLFFTHHLTHQTPTAVSG